MIVTLPIRKLAVMAHVISSLGWIGAIASFLALSITGLISQDAQMMRAGYLAMDLTYRFVIVPFGLASLLTGLVLSLSTEWGLFRYYWVLVKFLLTVAAVIVMLVHALPVSYLASAMAQSTVPNADLRGLRIQLIVDAAAALLVLLVATTLSAYKPRGKTRYGARKRRALTPA